MSRRERTTLDVAAKVLDLNQRLTAIIAGSLSAGAGLLLHPLLVLPVIAALGGASFASIGFMTMCLMVATLLSQLIYEPGWRQRWPLPWVALLTSARAVAGVLLALGIGVSGGNVGALILIGGLYWLLAGLGHAVTDTGELASKSGWVGPVGERISYWAGIVGVLGGLVLARLSGPSGQSFPAWAVLVALLASLLLGLAAVVSWRLVPAPNLGSSIWSQLIGAPALVVHGRRLRRYLGFRVVLMASMLLDPLLLVYGLQYVDLPVQSIGIYLALYALVRAASALLAPGLIASGYARPMAQLGSLARLLIPLLAVALPMILGSRALANPGLGWVAPTAFGLVVVLLALAVGMLDAADAAYLRDALAPVQRPAVRALWLLLLIVLSLVYPIGGMVVERWGFQVAWIVAFAAGLLAVLSSGLLLIVPPEETREMTSTGALPTFREATDW